MVVKKIMISTVLFFYLQGGGRRGGRPEGLRGRDIGMFYAARSKAKMKEREFQEVQ